MLKLLSTILLITACINLAQAQNRKKLIISPDSIEHPKPSDKLLNPQPGGSNYKLIDEGKNERFSTVQVIIRSAEGPLMRGYVRLINNENKTIVSYMTDEKGYAYFLLFETKDLKSIIIDDIGYYRVVIPISKIKNRISKIEVSLQGQSTSN